MEENDNGYHVYGQNIDYQYPQKVINDSKYLTVVEKGKPIIAYTSSTAQIGIINESFYRTGNNGAFQGLFPKFNKSNFNVIVFILECIKRTFIGFGYNTSMANILDIVIHVPTKNKNLDFDFIESFIAELEAERIAELEAERIAELSAYLKVSGLDNYELSVEELKALRDYDSLEWKEFNLEKLFGKSTRGKRLRSLDRISGDLPFVTAGETNTGISAYISNEVEIFKANTVTIDMFGSAKYRNYDYGADDHIAVVHTEKLNKFASLFTTAAIHKASYSGKFSYDKNFYAKDADELVIALPVDCQGVIQYDYMSLIASAIQKLVIKDVVKYTNERIETTKEVVTSHNTNY